MQVSGFLVESGGIAALDTAASTLYWIGQQTNASTNDPFYLIAVDTATAAVTVRCLPFAYWSCVGACFSCTPAPHAGTHDTHAVVQGYANLCTDDPDCPWSLEYYPGTADM